MFDLLYAILAVAVVSLLSLVGVFAISLKESTLDRILFVLLSFSAGSILGAAYLDLLPEAIEFLGEEQLSVTVIYVTIGFLGFFFLERNIYWYHGHVHGNQSDVEEKMVIKKFVYLNVIGDGVHNLIDGMIIAASFFINISVGLATTIAVIFHELPQEIGDFGVLVYGGLTRYRALFVNFLSALTAVVGVFVSNYLSIHTENFIGLLIALAAGGFIYLAASELIPEIRKEENVGKSMIQFILFVFGIVLIWSLGLLFPA
ncbi:MAG: ZIP family metal transporter [Candidatus Bathyarchaeota archaeon]|nr:ZIP family metal transporter [Candidatus Bathyarchaeota archaeon]MDH5624134.1 ZIP family metal transporter [Candidatus Bathyarchaeota archaeon]MDH5635525.1 ZIP family metal transporter [Candidatus Bathyarchaeota archaeon]MDH5702024.1 ZIP family metal transporter [Candidatus Bathyarchaeota archaeon]